MDFRHADRVGLDPNALTRWASIENYSPDARPSDSRYWIADRGTDVMYVLEVKGLGALALRASQDDSRWTFNGMSVFTDEEIRRNVLDGGASCDEDSR